MYLGIDVGSTTVKIVVMDPETKQSLFSRYLRHNAYQAETVRSLLEEIFSRFPGRAFRAAVCGSGGKPIAEAIHAPYIQEVVANAIAVRNFYPSACVAVELGGQDAKLVFFHHDEATGRLTTSDMRMNGTCAGGTGSFIDEVANLLRLPVEEFEGLAAQGTCVYDISGRCGVFAKTDIQPLLNQGVRREDIALSTFHAIAKQTIGGLAQGLELKPPVIFEGGPCTFNPTLIRVFQERLGLSEGDVIRPENPEIVIAHGVALSLGEIFADYPEPFVPEAALNALGAYRENLRSSRDEEQRFYFDSPEKKAAFEERHTLPPPPSNNAAAGSTLSVYLGIDIGSTTTKFVLLDDNEQPVDSFYANNRGEPLEVIKKALTDMDEKYRALGVTLDIKACGTTGYGELLFAKALGADYHTVETVAHAAAAQKYVPDVSFILDIGGQDMKAITIANGIVTNITLNEACSSGCGSFLENFAATLHIPVETIAQAAFGAKNPAELGSRCTVFMNSTIITEQKNGKQADDIMAGLCRSIIENVFTKVVRISNVSSLGKKVIVQGGTFKNDAVLRALEQYLGREVVRAPYPGEMGAIGIALLTKKHVADKGFKNGVSRFIGLGAVKNLSYTQEANNICPFCTNNCNRTLITFSNGTTWVTGNRCERGEVVGDVTDTELREKIRQISVKLDAVPDMVRVREKLLFQDYPWTPLCPDRGITIGLPRVFDFWRAMPFWTTFYHALGFGIRISRPSSKKLFERGLQFVASDTVCFPAKMAHGHIHDLVDSKVTRIFMPMINRLPSETSEPLSTYTCPVLKGYPLVIRYSDDPEHRLNIPLDTPLFHWFTEKDRDDQLARYMRDTFGIDPGLTRRAIIQGDRSLASFYHVMAAEGAEVIARVEKDGGFAVVLAARYYQYDELVNHNLSRYFTNIGIPVLTLDSLPGLRDVDLSKTMLDITNNNHAQLLSGAIIAARHPLLEYVQVFSFGCGHDALYTDEVTRLMAEISGKAPLILKLDESDVAGPLRIRVRSFIETVNARCQKAAQAIESLGDPYPVKFKKNHRKTRTILVPNTSAAFTKILSTAIGKQGCLVEPLPMSGRASLQAGKKYLHNDICFPAQVVIGEAIAYIQKRKFRGDEIAVGMAKFNCDCRLTNYSFLLRRALDEAGYTETPIISTDQLDRKSIHPGFKLSGLSYVRAIWCLIMADILEDLRRKIRPYELEKGETNRVFDQSVDSITYSLKHRGMLGALRAYRYSIDEFCKIRYDRSVPRPVVFIIGEYIANYHPDCNYHIEEYLEQNNMEVKLARMYDVFRKYLLHTVSDVKDFHIRHSLSDTLTAFGGNAFFDIALDGMEKIARKHPLYQNTGRLPRLAEKSDPIIHHSINSGESFLISAELLHNAAEGIRSFVILQPFGCLPNHICGRGVIKKIKEQYPEVQILPLDYDPDTSFANVENRLQMLIMNAREASICG